MENEMDLLVFMSSQEFQWYALGWSTQFLRYLVGSWKNIKVNSIITLSEDQGSIMKFKVIEKTVDNTLQKLVNNSNYINLYPLSQNYQTTIHYLQNKLRKQKLLINTSDDIPLGLFTIKPIR